MKHLKPVLKFLGIILFSSTSGATLMADEILMIDDRRSGELQSALGSSWRMFTDGVMGGVSRGSLSLDNIDGRSCLRLRGEVSLKNNGGFIQSALDVAGTEAADASGYQGLLLEVYGNGEEYNLHLRTTGMRRPWQSYRQSFLAGRHWETYRLAFAEFEAYRIDTPLDLELGGVGGLTDRADLPALDGVVGDVLERQQAFVRLELQHLVDQQKWIAVRQQAQHLMDVHRVQNGLLRKEGA